MTGAARQNAAANMVQTCISYMNCPSRRAPGLWTVEAEIGKSVLFNIADDTQMVSPDPTNDHYLAARSDYAANGGTYPWDPNAGNNPVGGSHILGSASNTAAVMAKDTFGWTATYPTAADLIGTDANRPIVTGVIFCGSLIRPVDVRDGTAHTLMVGEKYINRKDYLTGLDGGDNECMYIGDNTDITRWTGTDQSLTPPQTGPGFMTPLRDGIGLNASSLSNPQNYFGSAHPSSVNCVMCDGSVHSIAYSIDGATFSRLGSRNDGKGISTDAY